MGRIVQPMRLLRTIFGALLIVAGTISAAQSYAAEESCAGLATIRLAQTEITDATAIKASTFIPPARAKGVASAVFATLPAFCRVRAVVRPTADSDVAVELWLPAAGWNGRFEAVGNGGFQSTINYEALAKALADGYAVAASNAGHDTQDGSFAYGHPEKLIDWGYRAIHEMTLTAKTLIALRYGRAAAFSYWNSCSTGGRQGLNAAERYPADFDGLAIGAPANPMTRLQLASLWNNLAVHKESASYLSRDAWQLVHAAVLRDCDAADGLVDGLINEPLGCGFAPDSLACKAGVTKDCLSAAQITALTAIYGGATNPRTAARIYPGWAPSFEGNMPGPTAGPVPQQDAIDTFRAVFQDPTWDYHTLDFDRDVVRSDALGDATVNAADPAVLTPLFKRGGKVLMYHGWNDVGISALGSLAYYQKAVAAGGGIAQTENAIRLFLAPGMNHCETGDGPNQFDKMAPLTAWVEKGITPERIDAAHYNSAGAIDRTRPLCAYPKVARYAGHGSIDDAANFSCGAATLPAIGKRS